MPPGRKRNEETADKKNVVEIEKLYLKGEVVANGFDGKL